MKKTGKTGAIERRKTNRRSVLESFSLWAVVPKKGAHRLPVYDLSEDGIAFDLDIEGETQGEFPIIEGEVLDLHLYLNQSLHLPLKIQIARIEDQKEIRRVGASFCEADSPGHRGLLGLVQMIDQLLQMAQIHPQDPS